MCERNAWCTALSRQLQNAALCFLMPARRLVSEGRYIKSYSLQNEATHRSYIKRVARRLVSEGRYIKSYSLQNEATHRSYIKRGLNYRIQGHFPYSTPEPVARQSLKTLLTARRLAGEPASHSFYISLHNFPDWRAGEPPSHSFWSNYRMNRMQGHFRSSMFF